MLAAIALSANLQGAAACEDIQLFAISADGIANPVPLETRACESVKTHYPTSDLMVVKRPVMAKSNTGAPQLGNTHSNPTESERSNTELGPAMAKLARLAGYCADLHAAAKSSVGGAHNLVCLLVRRLGNPQSHLIEESLTNKVAEYIRCGPDSLDTPWQKVQDALTRDAFLCEHDRCRRNIPKIVLEASGEPTLLKATFAVQSIELYHGAWILTARNVEDCGVSSAGRWCDPTHPPAGESQGICVLPVGSETVAAFEIDR